MAKATITAVATREKLGVPSDSLKTPRQKVVVMEIPAAEQIDLPFPGAQAESLCY